MLGNFFIKNTEISILAVKHIDITSEILHQISLLKKTFWRYSIFEQKKYIKANASANDLHICLFLKSSLIGYTFLKKKKSKLNLKKLILLDTIVIKNKFQNKGFSKILMSINNFIILNILNCSGFLVCKSNYINYYKKFNWKLVKTKKIIRFFDLKKTYHLMSLN